MTQDKIQLHLDVIGDEAEIVAALKDAQLRLNIAVARCKLRGSHDKNKLVKRIVGDHYSAIAASTAVVAELVEDAIARE